MAYLKKRRLCRCNKCGREFKSSLVKPACSDASCRSSDVDILEGPGSPGHSDPAAPKRSPKLVARSQGFFAENKEATAELIPADSFTPEMKVFRTLLDSARIDFSAQITEMVFSGDPTDVAWLNKVLLEGGVHLPHKRRFIVTYWLSKQGYSPRDMNVDAVVSGGDGMHGTGGGSEFDKAMAEMVRARTKAEQLRMMDGPHEEEMVAIEQTDETGKPIGQQLMVPASRWFQLESLKIQAAIANRESKPAGEESSALQLYKMLFEIQKESRAEHDRFVEKMLDARSQRDPDREKLEIKTAMQEHTHALEKRVDELIHLREKEQLTSTIKGPLDQQIQQLHQELRQMAAASNQSAEQHRFSQEAAMNNAVITTVKGATEEFRGGRKDMKELAMKYMQASLEAQQGNQQANLQPRSPEEAEEAEAWLESQLGQAEGRGASMIAEQGAPRKEQRRPEAPAEPDDSMVDDSFVIR